MNIDKIEVYKNISSNKKTLLFTPGNIGCRKILHLLLRNTKAGVVSAKELFVAMTILNSHDDY